MKLWWLLSGLYVVGLAHAQSSAQDIFVGMQPLEGVNYEIYDADAVSDDGFIPSSAAAVQEVEPEGIGYRFFYTQGYPPEIAYTDVCPSGFETVWYTIEVNPYTPVNFDFQGEVHPIEGVDGEDFGFSYYPGSEAQMDTPLYVGSCQYSDRRNMSYRSNNLNAQPAIVDLSRVFELSCDVSVVNLEKRTVMAEQTLDNLTFCYGELTAE